MTAQISCVAGHPHERWCRKKSLQELLHCETGRNSIRERDLSDMNAIRERDKPLGVGRCCVLGIFGKRTSLQEILDRGLGESCTKKIVVTW